MKFSEIHFVSHSWQSIFVIICLGRGLSSTELFVLGGKRWQALDAIFLIKRFVHKKLPIKFPKHYTGSAKFLSFFFGKCLKCFFYLKVQSFRLVMENNFIQMAASAGMQYPTRSFQFLSTLSIVRSCISPMASRILSFKALIVSELSA